MYSDTNKIDNVKDVFSQEKHRLFFAFRSTLRVEV